MKYVGWLVAGIILIAWYFWPSPTIVQQAGEVKTDTVYLPTPLPIAKIDTAKATKPVKVVIHASDTAARAQAEKQDIITAVTFDSHKITVEKLTPRGIGIRQEYSLPELSAVRIDGNGQAQITSDTRKAKRQKLWRKVSLIGAAVGGLIIGIAI